MKWEIVHPRDLQLLEATREEEQYIIALGERMRNPRHGVQDAQAMVENLHRDVLEKCYLENQRLNRRETLTQFSAWCHTRWKHKRASRYAQEISRTLFSGLVIPRLIDTDSRTLPEAEDLLDKFLQEMIEQSKTYTFAQKMAIRELPAPGFQQNLPVNPRVETARAEDCRGNHADNLCIIKVYLPINLEKAKTCLAIMQEVFGEAIEEAEWAASDNGTRRTSCQDA